MPMTVLVEPYWREISQGLASYEIPVHHFVLHADEETLRQRIHDDSVMGPSSFRYSYLVPYAEAFHAWLGNDAQIIDTTQLTPTRQHRRSPQQSVARSAEYRRSSAYSPRNL
jgi:hypothetical protein